MDILLKRVSGMESGEKFWVLMFMSDSRGIWEFWRDVLI